MLGVRDYIHVVDLAKGHIAALKKLKENCGCKVGSSKYECVLSYPGSLCVFMQLKYFWDIVLLQIYNLGTGKGYSVFQMVKAVEQASGKKVSGSPCVSVADQRVVSTVDSRCFCRSHTKSHPVGMET